MTQGRDPAAPYTTIGTAELLEPAQFTQHYSYAAWYSVVACDPQTVLLRDNGYYVLAVFEGVRSAAYFGAGNERGHGVGRPDSYVWQAYRHEYDRWMAQGGTLSTFYGSPDETVKIRFSQTVAE